MNKCKMCLVVESYDCYNVSEGTYGFVRYICGDECLYFWDYDSDHVFIWLNDLPYVSKNLIMILK